MRYGKYLLCAWLLALLVILSACNKAPDPSEDTSNTPDEQDPTVEQISVPFSIAPTDGVYAYTVVRNDVGSEAERAAMINICTALKDTYGTLPKMDIYYESDGGDRAEAAARIELLVGKTGRPESNAAYEALTEGQYTIRVIGNKLVVLGKTDELTTFAVHAFLEMLKSAPTELAVDYDHTVGQLRDGADSFDFAALGYIPLPDVRFEYRNGENSTQVLYVTSDDYHYTCGYYTRNTWINDDIMIAARSSVEDATQFGRCDLVILDLRKKQAWLLPIAINNYDNYVVAGELLYFLPNPNELHCLNLLTGRSHLVATVPGMSYLHITADGSHVNTSRRLSNMFTGTVIDLQTGKYYDVLSIRFEEPYTVANHIMICPTDPTMVFFAHEGTTTDVADRLWIAKLGEEPYNIAYQRTDDEGKPIDCFGHEFWAPDGKGVYFVKYTVSPSKPAGVCYVSLDDIENPQILYSKYPYWHTSCSPDQKYITADGLDNGYSGVYLIDTQTDQEILIYKAQTYNAQHPGHPHPRFSVDGTVLAFHDRNMQNGQLSLAFYYLFE